MMSNTNHTQTKTPTHTHTHTHTHARTHTPAPDFPLLLVALGWIAVTGGGRLQGGARSTQRN